MKLVILASTLGAAAAFAPNSLKASSVVLGDARSPDGLGVDPGPLDLWDPLGFADDIDSFARRRAVEIKHGRISMIAFIGMLVQELGVTFPGSLDLSGQYPFSDVLSDGMGFPALAHIPTAGIAQIVLFAGLAECAPPQPHNTLEDHRTFQVVTKEAPHLFPMDILLPIKLRMKPNVTESLTLRSRTGVLLCLVLLVP